MDNYERDQEIIRLRNKEGKSYGEIGKIIGITSGVAASVYHRWKKPRKVTRGPNFREKISFGLTVGIDEEFDR